MAENIDKTTTSSSNEFLPAIRRARFDRLTIYEVSDRELDLLERGSPDSLFLNFAIALLSIAISLSVTFATTKIESDRNFIVLVLITIVGYVIGLFLLILWFRNHKSVLTVAKTIRERLPPEGTDEGIGQHRAGIPPT